MKYARNMRGGMTAAFLAIVFAMAAFAANADLTPVTWRGGPSGNYADTSNWDPAVDPNASSYELVFTNAATVTLTATRTIGKISVSGGNVNIKTSTTSVRFAGGNSSQEAVYDVASGKTLSFTGFTAFNASKGIVKTGAGTLSCDCAIGESDSNGPRTLEVAAGIFHCKLRYGAMRIQDTITVRSGAELWGYFLDQRPTQIRPYTKLVIEAGGKLDYKTLSGTFGPLSGGGTLVGLGKEGSPVVLTSVGEGGFTGTLEGYVKFAPTNDVPFVVSNSNAVLNATVSFDEESANPFAFAPGVEYYVKNPGQFAGHDVDPDGNPATLVVTGNYTHTAAGDDTWPANWKIVGSGTITEKSGGTWTINNFSLAGGTIALNAAATSTNLVIAGGTSERVSMNLVTKTTYNVDFTGGEHQFGYITGEKYLTYRQTGGKVTAYPLLSTFSSGSTHEISYNEIFYTMTGGTLYSKPTSRAVYGLGLEVGGTAKAYLYSDGGTHQMIAYRTNHTVRVKDNGYLYADHIDFAHYSGGSRSLARLELLGGTCEVAYGLGYQHLDGAGSVRGRLLFDGGRLVAREGLTVVPMNRSTYAFTDDQFTTLVGEGGGEISVTRVGSSTVGLNWYGPVVAAVGEGRRDGGLVKTGRGTLKFNSDLDISGPLTIRHGQIRNAAASPTKPFGVGDVVLEFGLLTTVDATADMTAATGEGSALAYRNASGVDLNTKSLTAGAIRREGHGVLFVRRSANNGKVGTGVNFKVNSGVANDPTTGLSAQPVFSYTPTVLSGKTDYPTRGGGLIGFLTYNDEVGFSNAVATVGIPEVTTSASICEISGGHFDLTRDAAVGAIAVWAPWTKNDTGNLAISDGCTLTIGNGAGTLAPLVLNNVAMICSQYDGIGKGSCKVSGGTVAFGAAEGLVLVNTAWRNYTTHESAYVSSKLTGTGGVTFAAPWFGQNQNNNMYLVRAVDVEGDNELSGNVWIEGVSVRVRRPTGLGSGTVNVEGNVDFGGRLVLRNDYTGTSFTNPLVISGFGPKIVSGLPAETGATTILPPEDGALSVLRDVRLTGGVTLADDAGVYVGGGRTAEIASTITGPGRLEVSGPGTLRLSAANSFSGGLYVRAGSTLEIAGAGTCGTGTLSFEKGAVLRFVDRSTMPDGFEFEGECAIEFGAAPTGSEGFVKTGADRQILRVSGDYTGPTVVAEGTLALDYPTPEELPLAEGVAFRFDASDADTVTYDENTLAVSEWADADGRSGVFGQAIASRKPQYEAEAFGGRGAIYFPGTAAQQLTNAAANTFQTVFAVVRTGDETGEHPLNGSSAGSWRHAPLIGYLGGVAMNDMAIAIPKSVQQPADMWAREDLAAGAEIRVNGVDTNGFAFGESTVVSVAMAAQAVSMPLAVGETYNWPNYNYSYYGRIGEIVAYKNFLGEEERRMVEKHLMTKWGLAPKKPVVKNMLPATTDLEVAAGATLDLAGTYQEVGTLNLAGEIVNSASGTLSVLRINEGRSYVSGGSLGPDIELQVRHDAVLDLCGGTLTVDWVKCAGTEGNPVNIVNGTLIVRKGWRKPFGGWFLIVR